MTATLVIAVWSGLGSAVEGRKRLQGGHCNEGHGSRDTDSRSLAGGASRAPTCTKRNSTRLATSGPPRASQSVAASAIMFGSTPVGTHCRTACSIAADRSTQGTFSPSPARASQSGATTRDNVWDHAPMWGSTVGSQAASLSTVQRKAFHARHSLRPCAEPIWCNSRRFLTPRGNAPWISRSFVAERSAREPLLLAQCAFGLSGRARTVWAPIGCALQGPFGGTSRQRADVHRRHGPRGRPRGRVRSAPISRRRFCEGPCAARSAGRRPGAAAEAEAGRARANFRTSVSVAGAAPAGAPRGRVRSAPIAGQRACEGPCAARAAGGCPGTMAEADAGRARAQRGQRDWLPATERPRRTPRAGHPVHQRADPTPPPRAFWAAGTLSLPGVRGASTYVAPARRNATPDT